MAREIKTENLEIKTTKRGWRTNLETPLGQDSQISAYREIVKTAGKEVIAKEPGGVVTRYLSAVAAEKITLNSGLELSVAQVAEAIKLFIEKWEIEDEGAQ